jgi:hypothetical protein
MTNSQDRRWLEDALAFWHTAKPRRGLTRKIIVWNIENLERWLQEVAR